MSFVLRGTVSRVSVGGRRPELLRSYLDAGFVSGVYRFAGGDEANHKLELGSRELFRKNPVLWGMTVLVLTSMVREAGPELDTIVAVPTGADGYAQAVAKTLNVERRRARLLPVQCVLLDKDDAGNIIVSEAAERELDGARQVAIMEDVGNRRGSIDKVERAAELAGRVSGAFCVVDRGLPETILQLDYPVHSIVQYPIPPKIPESSPLYAYVDPAIQLAQSRF